METREMVCINCPLGCMLTVTKENDGSVTVTGNTCPRGETYGRTEMTAPKRVVTSTVRIKDKKNAVISVKTAEPIPKGKIRECIEALKEVEVSAPVAIGDVIIENVADTGVNVVATKEVTQ